jgi:hypothetical protein
VVCLGGKLVIIYYRRGKLDICKALGGNLDILVFPGGRLDICRYKNLDGKLLPNTVDKVAYGRGADTGLRRAVLVGGNTFFNCG